MACRTLGARRPAVPPTENAPPDGFYWTKSDDGDNDARVVRGTGSRNYRHVNRRTGGARPALPFSSISSITTNGESGKRARDGILEVEYGYYPQKAVSRDMQERLERAYRSSSISKTGNSYTTDSVAYGDLPVFAGSTDKAADAMYTYEFKGWSPEVIKDCFCECKGL